MAGSKIRTFGPRSAAPCAGGSAAGDASAVAVLPAAATISAIANNAIVGIRIDRTGTIRSLLVSSRAGCRARGCCARLGSTATYSTASGIGHRRAAGLEAGHQLQRLDQRVVPLAAQAARLQRAVHIEDQAGAQQWRTELVRGGQHQPQILLLQVDREAGPPVAPHDL